MQTKKFDSLIFDMDGTLWDATQTYADEWNETARRMGVENFHITASQLHQYMGMSIDKIFKEVFVDYPKIDPEEFCRVVDSVEDEMLPVQGGIPYPGMREGIKQLASHYKILMVSNCGAMGLKNFMKFNNLNEYITDTLTFGETGNQKAENIKAIVARNNLKSPIYIGDTQGDCNESHRAGIPFAFAAYGFGDCKDFDFKFDSFSQLTNYFINEI